MMKKWPKKKDFACSKEYGCIWNADPALWSMFPGQNGMACTALILSCVNRARASSTFSSLSEDLFALRAIDQMEDLRRVGDPTRGGRPEPDDVYG